MLSNGNENSYWFDLMKAPYSQLLYQPIEPRSVHYCIIDAHQFSDFNKVKESVENLKLQKY
jgi:hypothetical protein